VARWFGGAITGTLGGVAAPRGVTVGVTGTLRSWRVLGGLFGVTLVDGWEFVCVGEVLV
jgi:hypothetical protein